MAFQRRRGGVLETSYIQSSFFEEMSRQAKVADTILRQKTYILQKKIQNFNKQKD